MFDHRAPLSLRYAGSSSESSNIADVLDELRGIPERDRKVESSLMPASQSSLTSWRSTLTAVRAGMMPGEQLANTISN